MREWKNKGEKWRICTEGKIKNHSSWAQKNFNEWKPLTQSITYTHTHRNLKKKGRLLP